MYPCVTVYEMHKENESGAFEETISSQKNAEHKTVEQMTTKQLTTKQMATEQTINTPSNNSRNLSQINRVNALYTRGCLLTKVCPLQSLRDLSMCICVGNKKYQTMAFVQRGLVFYQSRKYTMAIHDFQSALKNGYFQLPDVYRLLGLAYIQLNLSTRAIQTYTEGIKCQTIPDVKLLLCRAEAYYYSNEKLLCMINHVLSKSNYLRL
ncbi:tetratricopeptide repeat 6 [Schistosoma japonicum]|uniref:Tetratricopeptide repeat 6 n=1 Tax=Schistosoma japonicum TaxID=6182 RepID=A0A4Z2D2N8_SCHJA|nr:tetratricopeptide repeat 6 [Schistosoma japonicum]